MLQRYVAGGVLATAPATADAFGPEFNTAIGH
jgi:hypothetical protein